MKGKDKLDLLTRDIVSVQHTERKDMAAATIEKQLLMTQEEARELTTGIFKDLQDRFEGMASNVETGLEWTVLPMHVLDTLSVKEVRCLMAALFWDTMCWGKKQQNPGSYGHRHEKDHDFFWFGVGCLDEVINGAEQNRILTGLETKDILTKKIEDGFGGKRFIKINYLTVLKLFFGRGPAVEPE